MNVPPHTQGYERCVLCGTITSIPVSMPIDQRVYYEVGLGQLCSDCAAKLQSDARQPNTLSYEQLVLAIERSRTDKQP